MVNLLDECLDALGEKMEILSEGETLKIFKSFTSTIPITKWGVIDWSAVDIRFMVSGVEDIEYIFGTHKPKAGHTIYILWNDSVLPAIKVDMRRALRVIDDVTAVSFDTWLFNDTDKYVIEFNHEGLITIGFV